MVFFFPFFFFFFLLKNMAEAGTGFLEQLKSCIVWSWTYLWTLWFFIMLFLVYILRVPLKINDNLTTGFPPCTAASFTFKSEAGIPFVLDAAALCSPH
uniref:Suppressor of tumorigenicity 7 protein n=2 Tax=Neognathae TaxID=8825 RepID=A0A8V0X2M8_CHICK